MRPGERVIDGRQVVEHQPQPRLKLLPEFPRHGQRHGGIVENVADEVQPGDFARDGRAVHEEGGHDDVNDLCTDTDVCTRV